MGFSKQEILELFIFIDWVVTLPREKKTEYMGKLAKSVEKEFKNFIPPSGEIWFEKSIEKNTVVVISKMLKERIPLKLISKITELSVIEMQKIKEINTKKH